jgi:hypothetical protein
MPDDVMENPRLDAGDWVELSLGMMGYRYAELHLRGVSNPPQELLTVLRLGREALERMAADACYEASEANLEFIAHLAATLVEREQSEKRKEGK